MKKNYLNILLCLIIFGGTFCFSQPFQTIGSAYSVPSIQNSNCENAEACFTLTDNINWQQGAVWDLDTLDLTHAFDATFCMFIGANDGGADGFAFVIRSPNSNNYGDAGGGIGYGSSNGAQGIFPSIAIEFDSFYNPDYFDIQEDHTALVINAEVSSIPAVPAISLLPNGANVEDNSFHNSRIVWDPITQQLAMYFDGNLRFTYTNDIINTVFNGDSKVLWGFTASTGGLSNLHQICFPKIDLSIPNQVVCFEDSVAVSYFHENLTEYYWMNPQGEQLNYWNNSFGTELTDTIIYVSQNGVYELHVEFNNKNYFTTFNVLYDNSPPLNLGNDTIFCIGQSLNLTDLNNTTWSNRMWSNNSSGTSLQVSNPGTYWLQAYNNSQCIYRDSIVIANFPNPSITLLPFDSSACAPGIFSLEVQNEQGTNFTWNFEDGTTITDQNQVNYFNAIAGDYSFTILAISENNCTLSTTFNEVLHVLEVPVADFQYAISETDLGYEVNLTNQSFGFSISEWTVNQNISSTEENHFFQADQQTNEVQLVVSNSICSDTIIKFIILTNNEVVIPNIITNPGSNLPNSLLTLFADNFKNFELDILNRWGNLVYQGVKDNSNPLYLWNGIDKQSGKICSDGVYYLVFKGELKNNNPFDYHGFVTIVNE